MNEAMQRVVDSAMGATNHLGIMVRHYENLVTSAQGGASPSREVTDSLERDLTIAKRDFAVGMQVLGSVLDAIGYDVRGPVEGDPEFFVIHTSKVEAELDRWREQQKVSG